MHIKNKTKFKSLDRLASDPRIIEIWDETEQGHGLWLQLAPGWNCNGGSMVHRWSVKDLVEYFKLHVTEGASDWYSNKSN